MKLDPRLLLQMAQERPGLDLSVQEMEDPNKLWTGKMMKIVI